MHRITAGIIGITCVAGFLTGCAGSPMDGKYVLVERTLPDGTVQQPPMVNGFMSYEDNVRTMNMNWSDESGQHSVSYVGVFDFSKYEYAERNVAFVQSSPNSSLIQNFEDFTGTSEVVYTKDGVRFNFPIHSENVRVKMTEDGFITTAEGKFTDHWKKVEVVTPEAQTADSDTAFAGFLKPVEIPGAASNTAVANADESEASESDEDSDETVTVEATEEENPAEGG